MSPLIKPGEKPSTWDKILSTAQAIIWISGVVFAVGLVVIRTFAKYGQQWFAFASRILGVYGARTAVGFAVIGFGIGAHRFKQWNQKWYGSVEVAFGAAAGVSICLTLSPGQTLFSQWIALLGCVYVIARGLNNITDAKPAAAKRNPAESSLSLPS